jgi:hypothetical protein
LLGPIGVLPHTYIVTCPRHLRNIGHRAA